jgi:hypothetical protein
MTRSDPKQALIEGPPERRKGRERTWQQMSRVRELAKEDSQYVISGTFRAASSRPMRLWK